MFTTQVRRKTYFAFMKPVTFAAWRFFSFMVSGVVNDAAPSVGGAEAGQRLLERQMLTTSHSKT